MTELLYKSFFNAAPVPLIVTDQQGEIKLINERAKAFLDNKETPFSGSNFCDFIDGSFLKEYRNAKTFSFEDFLTAYKAEHKHWVKSKEGHHVYADINAVSFGSGNHIYYIWTLDPVEIGRKLSYDLKERVKEQLSIVDLIEVFFQNPNIKTALELSLDPIREGWQYPEVTGVRIVLGSGEEFSTENFRKTGWLLQSEIKSTNEHYGFLEVCYLTEVPAYEGSIFLPEEGTLIRLLGRVLGVFIEQWRAIDKIKSDALLLKNITSQVPANTYQFEVQPDGRTKILFMSLGTDAYNHSINDSEPDIDELLEVIYEPDKLTFKEALAKAYRTNDFLSVHYRVVFNDTIRWRWLRAVPENRADGRTIWYGATQDITLFIEYITSIEQILFDISHIIRRPIANILGMSKLIKDADLNEKDMLDITKKILNVFEELDSYIQQLNISYDKKRQLNQEYNIDFSPLVDNRDSFFDKAD
ncbi:hypothetical protein GZH53_10165 [Flavihumibacter sp. R14]|nr:hypothetical protein [Flavihumibacter soli]